MGWYSFYTGLDGERGCLVSLSCCSSIFGSFSLLCTILTWLGFMFPFCSKTFILQLYYHHVLCECHCYVGLCICSKWSSIWALVFMTTFDYFTFFSHSRTSSEDRCSVDRMNEIVTVCYHAFYFPLLYATFLSDFFQVNSLLLIWTLSSDQC